MSIDRLADRIRTDVLAESQSQAESALAGLGKLKNPLAIVLEISSKLQRTALLSRALSESSANLRAAGVRLAVVAQPINILPTLEITERSGLPSQHQSEVAKTIENKDDMYTLAPDLKPSQPVSEPTSPVAFQNGHTHLDEPPLDSSVSTDETVPPSTLDRTKIKSPPNTRIQTIEYKVSPPSLPWLGRDDATWIQLVNKSEAVRLFSHSKLDEEYTPSDLAEFIATWHLQQAFETFWNASPEELSRDISRDRGERTTVIRTENTSRIESAVALFEDRRLFDYLLLTRDFIKKSGSSYQQPYSPPLPEVAEKYEELVALFFPMAKSAALRKSRYSGDREEWIGIAGAQVAESVRYFYWEPLLIDPAKTIRRFIATTTKSIQDPSKLNFDTKTLEVSTEALPNYSIGQSVSDAVIDGQDNDRIQSLITRFARDPEAAEVIQAKISDPTTTNDEIGLSLGIPKDKVLKILGDFRDALRAASDSGEDLGVHIPEKKKVNAFWDDFFSNPDKYTQRLKTHGPMLKPFHRLVVQKFTELQTGEKEESLQAVCEFFASIGRPITMGTARRAVQAGCNQMMFIERDQYSAQTGQRWSRYQMSLLLDKIYQDPDAWGGYSESEQHILKRFYIEGRGSSVTRNVIADELGIHESTVSRTIDKIVRDLYRTRGSIVADTRLIYKPRNLLPR